MYKMWRMRKGLSDAGPQDEFYGERDGKTMKKKLIVLLIVMAMVFASACANKNGGNAGGTSENAGESESGTSETENESDEVGVYYTPESGMTIPASKTYAENEDKVYLYYAGGKAEEGLYYMEFYLYPDSYEKLNSMSYADYEKSEANSINVLNFLRVLDSAWPKDKLETWCHGMIGMEPGTLQEFGRETGREEGDYAIYYSLGKEVPDALSEEIKTIYAGIIDDFETAKDGLLLSDPVAMEYDMSGIVLDFETTDLDGNAVSSKEVFANNKYTMVNIWASWCGPCIKELPELEELNKEFEAKGCGIIGLLTDGTDPTGLSDAKEIIADTGVTYMNVIDNAEIANMLQITGVPTTIFVDENGKIVGRTIVGANPEAYKKVMEELLGE